MTHQSTNEYIFNSDWFTHNIPSLKAVFEYVKPQRILEIGSFEGRSTIFFMEEALKYQPQVEIHCIDSWEGGAEHQGVWNMGEVEQRFIHNITLALRQFQNAELHQHRSYSHQKMINLLANGYANYFDYIYVDGSHEAPDVLFDALLAHRLVKKGGVISFDDYLWSSDEMGKQRHYMLVKPAVDHYVNTYQQKVQVIQGLNAYQQHIIKLQD